MIIGQYRQMWQYMRKRVNKLWVITMIVCFAVGVLAACSVSFLDTETYSSLEQALYAPSSDEAALETWYGLWGHNIKADAINMVIGLVPFVPLPALDMALNDGILGTMCAMSGASWGVSPWIMFAVLVVPHGVVELPINTLAGVLGLIIWWDVTRKILGRNPESLVETLKQCARVFVLVIIPGLAVAGMLEAYLTPWVSTLIGW